MDNGIVVFQHGAEVFVRCERCGLSCHVPPELPAHAVNDFYREHRLDVETAAHPVECPWPAARSEVR